MARKASGKRLRATSAGDLASAARDLGDAGRLPVPPALDPKTGLIDPLNAFADSAVPAPYAVFPAWFRRFAFRVLSTRQLAVLLYVYSVSNRNGISFSLTEQAMADLGIRKRETLGEALGALEDLGFLLHRRMPVRLLRDVVRNVYQRPTTEFTLLTLLDRKRVDESLMPIAEDGAVDADPSHRSSSERSVVAGLSALTGKKSDVLLWSDMEPGIEKREFLVSILRKSLDRKRDAAKHTG